MPQPLRLLPLLVLAPLLALPAGAQVRSPALLPAPVADTGAF